MAIESVAEESQAANPRIYAALARRRLIRWDRSQMRCGAQLLPTSTTWICS